MTRGLTVAVLLLTSAAQADTLVDLRAFLGTLRGTTAIGATVEVQRNRKSAGRFANNQSAGGATYAVSADDAGLHITVPQAILERAAQETRARETDPKKQTPTRAAIDEMEATNMVEALNFSDSLQRMLRIGQRTAETRTMWQGRHVRLVTLKLTEPLPPQATSVFNVQFQDDSLKLWLADDHTPLAAERLRKGSARFLFLKGEMTNRESWTFARRDDRLVVTRYETAFAGSGFGQKGEGKTVQTVTVR